ncbi:MAG: DUF6807 family protein [Planctomycetaceae bacterium]
MPDGLDPLYARSGCLHPVSSPEGRIVTAMFPDDHAHQHGIFRHGPARHGTGGKWTSGTGSRHQPSASRKGRVSRSDRQWSPLRSRSAAPGDTGTSHRRSARERWTISTVPTDGTWHCFDLASVQTAMTTHPLVLEKYLYGGMAFRGPVEWLTESDSDSKNSRINRQPCEIFNDHGSDRIEGNHQHCRWVCLSGQQAEGTVSVTVMCHSENLRAPQAVRIHPTKPYFVFAPCVDDPFEITQLQPYAARYRYIITDSRPEPEWLNQQWNAWHSRPRDR